MRRGADEAAAPVLNGIGLADDSGPVVFIAAAGSYIPVVWTSRYAQAGIAVPAGIGRGYIAP